jgi:hypothetical protein
LGLSSRSRFSLACWTGQARRAQGRRATWPPPLLADQLTERGSVNILHCVEVAPVLAAHRENRHDVRVIELGDRLRLDAEAL